MKNYKPVPSKVPHKSPFHWRVTTECKGIALPYKPEIRNGYYVDQTGNIIGHSSAKLEYSKNGFERSDPKTPVRPKGRLTSARETKRLLRKLKRMGNLATK